MKTPVIPTVFHQVTHLGAREQVFPPRSRILNIGFNGVVALAGLGGAGYFVVTGILETIDRYYRLGPAVLVKTLMFPLLAAILLLIVGVFAAVRGWQQNQRWAVLYTAGAAVNTPNRMIAWQWGEFRAVEASLTRRIWLGIPMGIRHVYTYTKTSGETFTLDDRWQAVSDLADEIQTRTAPLIYARDARAFNSGENLLFGAAKLSRVEGIVLDHQSISWNDLVSIAVEHGDIIIKTRSHLMLHVPAATIQNLDVFLSLVDQKICVQVETPDQSR